MTAPPASFISSMFYTLIMLAMDQLVLCLEVQLIVLLVLEAGIYNSKTVGINTTCHSMTRAKAMPNMRLGFGDVPMISFIA